MPSANPKQKQIELIESPPPRHWVGNGFPVRTMFSYSEHAEAWSPFLLLDYAGPAEFSATDQRRGVGQHPHRGFETVTIVYQGEVEHHDSAGNRGKIGPGDVQWMTAASGILHEEYHGAEFARRGGMLEMAQLWVNLPARSKMAPPRYQDILSQQTPVVELPNRAGTVRVIAGECLGALGPARTFTPINLWDVRLLAGGSAELVVPDGHTAMMLVNRGPVMLNGATELPEAHLAVLERRGESFQIEARTEARLLFLGGEPIAEPVVGYGPFVMNTREEIEQALKDFQMA